MAEVMALLPSSVAYSLQSSMLPCSSAFTSIISDTMPSFTSRLPSQVAAAVGLEPDMGLPGYTVGYGIPTSQFQSAVDPIAAQYQPSGCE
jgi:hypothetical protein